MTSAAYPCAKRLAPDGSVVWERSYSDGGQNVARGLARTKDDTLVLVGSTTKGPDATNVLAVHLATDGSTLWERVFGSAT